MSTVLVGVRAVGKRYGAHVALAPTSLDVRAGEVLALIGPNGAGKSTLLSILAGALEPDEGEVVAPHPRLRVGWVPQLPAQYARLTPRENLELFARLERVERPGERARELVELLELPEDDRVSAELSGGNQQRLNLAVALLGRPDVLLLDEPTSSLDPRQRRRFWDVARAVRDRQGAVVFVTQNLEELERFADRVAVLLDGRVVFEGTLAQYAAAPQADVFA